MATSAIITLVLHGPDRTGGGKKKAEHNHLVFRNASYRRQHALGADHLIGMNFATVGLGLDQKTVTVKLSRIVLLRCFQHIRRPDPTQ